MREGLSASNGIDKALQVLLIALAREKRYRAKGSQCGVDKGFGYADGSGHVRRQGGICFGWSDGKDTREAVLDWITHQMPVAQGSPPTSQRQVAPDRGAVPPTSCYHLPHRA